MNTQVIWRDEVPLLKLSGRFDAHGVAAIRGWLRDMTAVARPRLIIDLGAVEYIDSAALGLLVASLKRCRERGGQMVLTSLAQPVRIIFELTQMDQVFPIAASEAMAWAAFTPEPGRIG